ncbi:hypothetical protein GDO78_019245 [Eleutherodactylus coqui]|uniref:Mitochondrial transcription termination factor 3 n=1 Tax=Eleutherodactylus coqui TaxID=57060 RepID=A0A8J6B814_ELECQ|nr:hypothetical protein GDO78_019245 [Eleutherodactylus coqui]
MALCMCQRSARCLLSALRNSLTTTPRQLMKDRPVSSQQFSRPFFIIQNAARKSIFHSSAASTQPVSGGDVSTPHPESNLPTVSQEAIVIPTVEMEPLEEALEDVAPDSPLDVITEEEAAMMVLPPPIPPQSVTLRYYVDHSETLQKLVQLGVDLSKLEKRPHVGTFLLKLDFQKDISKVLFFLKDVGVEDHQLGPFLTKNPFILSQDLDNLHKRY